MSHLGLNVTTSGAAASANGTDSGHFLFMQRGSLTYRLGHQPDKSHKADVVALIRCSTKGLTLVVLELAKSKPVFERAMGEHVYTFSDNRLTVMPNSSECAAPVVIVEVQTDLLKVKETGNRWAHFRDACQFAATGDAQLNKCAIPSREQLLKIVGPAQKSSISSGDKSAGAGSNAAKTTVSGKRGRGKAMTQIANTNAAAGSSPSAAALAYKGMSTHTAKLAPQAAAYLNQFHRPNFEDDEPENTPVSVHGQAATSFMHNHRHDILQHNRQLDEFKRNEERHREEIRKNSSSTAFGGRHHPAPYKPGASTSSNLRIPTSQVSVVSWLSSGSRPSLSSDGRRTGGGFRNLGNTCWMNAVLQALLGLPPFVQVSSREERHVNAAMDLLDSSIVSERPSALQRKLPDASVYKMLAGIAMKIRDVNRELISPQDLKASFGARNKLFGGYQQQDAHEFLSECLNYINQDVEDALLTDSERLYRLTPPKKLPDKPQPVAASSKGMAVDSAAAAATAALEESHAHASSSVRHSDRDMHDTCDLTLSDARPEHAFDEQKEMRSDEVYVAESPPPPDEADDEHTEERKEEPMQLFENQAASVRPATVSTAAVQVAPATPSPPPAASSMGLSPARHAELSTLLTQLSPVLRNFHCQLETDLECTTCKSHRKVAESFFHLSLDLPKVEPPSKPVSTMRLLPPSSHPPSDSTTTPLFVAPLPVTQPRQSSAASHSSADEKDKPSHSVSLDVNMFMSASKATKPEASSSRADDTVPASAIATHVPAAVAPSTAPASTSAPPRDALSFLMTSSERHPPPTFQISQLLQDFFRPREIEYRCTNGGCKGGSVVVSPHLSTLPRILILHLKRFEFNDRFRSEKRDDKVLFPWTLDVTEFVGQGASPPPPASVPAASTAASLPSSSSTDAAALHTPARSLDKKRKAPDSAPHSVDASRAHSPAAAARPSKIAKIDEAPPLSIIAHSPAHQAEKKLFGETISKMRTQHEQQCGCNNADKKCFKWLEARKAEDQRHERAMSAIIEKDDDANFQRAIEESMKDAACHSPAAAVKSVPPPSSLARLASPARSGVRNSEPNIATASSTARQLFRPSSSSQSIGSGSSNSSNSKSDSKRTASTRDLGHANVDDDVDHDEAEELKKVLAESKREADEAASTRLNLESLAEMDEPMPDGLTDEEQLELAMKRSLKSAQQETAAAATGASDNGNNKGQKHVYELISVVIHKGVTASSGHYVSVIHELEKRDDKQTSLTSAPAAIASTKGAAPASAAAAPQQSSIKRIWKEYDDSYVSTLSADRVKQNVEREGYIFFYSYESSHDADSRTQAAATKSNSGAAK